MNIIRPDTLSPKELILNILLEEWVKGKRSVEEVTEYVKTFEGDIALFKNLHDMIKR
mgnify:CR=1